MKNIIIIIAVIAVLVIGFFAWRISVKNDIIAKEEAIDEKWAQIDNLLLSRNDKIPNLVAPAMKLMSHEKDIFKQITDARTRLASGGLTREERMAASNEMSGAISRLLMVQESNPEIKADKALVGLMDEIAGMENRLAFGREEYNKAVKAYNTTIRQWPGSTFGYDKKEFFQVPESAKKNVDVNALLKND